jgi:putative phage-type endonuclease
MTTTIDTLESGTIIDDAGRADWLARRRSGLGASEAPAALALSPYQTPLALYLQKVGLADPDPETIPMRAGKALEGLIAEEYERHTGRAIVAREVQYRSPVRNWLSATIDAVTDAHGIAEFKTLSGRKAHEIGEDGTDELPSHWVVQAAVQMYCTGADAVDFAVLLDRSEMRFFTVPRDDRVIDAILPRLDEFWDRVQRQDPPPPTAGADAGLYRHLYPDPEGEVELAGDPAGDVAVYEALGREIGEKQRLRDMAKARLLAALGPAQVGRLADGRAVRRSVIEVKEHVVKGSTQTRLTISKGAK